MSVTRPPAIQALLFDVDGVLTDTAAVHERAWRQTFEDYGFTFGHQDYLDHVDGRSRLDGVRTFLAARGETEPEPARVEEIGARKNDLLLELLRTDGVQGYDDAGAFVRAAREQGLRTAVVSSSANAREALRSVGLEDCFDTWVDGLRIDRDGLPGKPNPDTFLAAAHDLGAEPSTAAVFEDATAGVAAGRAGDFGWVVGVDRTGHGDDLRRSGADVVVTDLGQIDL